MKNGQWTGGKPPFGYLRDSKTGEWLIDPVAGKYVRTIFDKASRDAVLLRFLII